VGSRHPTSRDLNLARSIDPGAFADAAGPSESNVLPDKR
jgi:hypothetical protein